MQINSLYLGQVLKVIKNDCFLYEKPFGKKIWKSAFPTGKEIGLSTGVTANYNVDGQYTRYVQLYTAGTNGKTTKAWVESSKIVAVSPISKNNNQLFINSLILIDQAIYLNLLNSYEKMLALQKAGIKIPKVEYSSMISIYRKLMERQQKIAEIEGVEVQRGFPASKLHLQKSWSKTLTNALSEKVEGFGFVPVIVIIVVAIVAVGATIAIYELFRPDYEDSQSDFELSSELDEKLKKYLPKDVYEQLQEEGENEVDDAYNAGKTKQKFEDIWGFVKYPVFFVAGLILLPKIIDLTKKVGGKK